MTRPTPPELMTPVDAGIAERIGGWFTWTFDWLAWIFFTPGDMALVVLLVEAPSIAERFELSTRDYGGGFSGAVSAGVWLIGLVVLVVLVRRRRAT